MLKSELIKRAGGVRALAKLLGITPSAIYQWRGDHVPPLRIYQAREILEQRVHEDQPRPESR